MSRYIAKLTKDGPLRYFVINSVNQCWRDIACEAPLYYKPEKLGANVDFGKIQIWNFNDFNEYAMLLRIALLKLIIV
jgi:hypothetical protein